MIYLWFLPNHILNHILNHLGAVDIDAIDDITHREATIGMIKNFGQTPTQLLKV